MAWLKSLCIEPYRRQNRLSTCAATHLIKVRTSLGTLTQNAARSSRRLRCAYLKLAIKPSPTVITTEIEQLAAAEGSNKLRCNVHGDSITMTHPLLFWIPASKCISCIQHLVLNSERKHITL